MGIPIDSEKIISFAEAGDYLPSSRQGKRIHATTLRRWAAHGCKAVDGTVVKLETIRAGSATFTSVAALQRFVDRLAQTQDPIRPKTESEATQEAARREAVRAELRAYGFK